MELFNIYWYDSEGKQHLEVERRPANEFFKNTLARLTQGPGAVAGVVKKVLVTDTGDCTNFLWEDGKVIYPTKQDIEEALQR